MLPLFALYENMLHFVLPLCSTLERPNPECPATNCTNIVDISQVGLKQFWNLKGHMQEASTLATAHYPETLDRIFVGASIWIHVATNLARSLVLHPFSLLSGDG